MVGPVALESPMQQHAAEGELRPPSPAPFGAMADAAPPAAGSGGMPLLKNLSGEALEPPKPLSGETLGGTVPSGSSRSTGDAAELGLRTSSCGPLPVLPARLSGE